MKTKSKKRILFFIVTISVLLGYQNCGQNYEVKLDGSTDKLVCHDNVCYERFLVDVTAGRQELPPLKMFFIVDNSYTMKANQVNLSSSFGKMFSPENTSDLTPFDTTAFLLSTSQRNPDFSLDPGSEVKRLSRSLLGHDSLAGLNLSDVENIYRGAHLVSGGIPGDLIGFGIEESEGGRTLRYRPAPILGFSESGGKIAIKEEMKKGVGERAAALEREFQNRLSVLDPDRNPTDYPFRSVLDNESGLCAMARVLRDNEKFVRPGELSTFVLVSDENDSDAEGSHCLAEHREVEYGDDLVKGKCETRRTAVKFNYDVNIPPQCTVSYKTGYQVSYGFNDPNVETTNVRYQKAINPTYTVPQTNVTYKKITSITYSVPRTSISYYRIKSQTYPQTRVSYYTKNCPVVVRDGVEIPQPCQYTQHQTDIWGSKVSNCLNEARALSSSAEVLGAYAPSCQLLANASKTCDRSDPLCVTEFELVSGQLVYGSYVNGTSACLTRAGQVSSQAILDDASRVPTCAPATNAVANGYCPNSLVSVGCLTSSVSEVVTVLVNGSYSTGAACTSLAATLSNADTGSGFVPTCVSAWASFMGAGTCQSANLGAAPGCVNQEQLSWASATIDGNFTGSLCQLRASQFADARVNAENPAECTLALVTRPRSGNYNISFDANLDAGVVQSVGSVCSEVLKQKARRAYGSVPASAQNEYCNISAVNGAGPVSVILSGGLSCDQLATSVCSSSNGVKRNCLSSYTAPINTSSNGQIDAKEMLTCQTLCSDSKTGYCQSQPGLIFDPAQTTVQKYLELRFGAKNCQTNTPDVIDASGSFSDRKISELASACAPNVDGSPRYAVPVGDVYHIKKIIAEPVSGDPSKDLVSYITGRSMELFNDGLRPIVSVFVRRSADPEHGQLADPIENGGSLGIHYEHLADEMGGAKYSIKSEDYSPALMELSDVVKSKLERSFVIPYMNGPQKVRSINHRKPGDTQWASLTESQWSQSGNTVLIQNFDFEVGDVFRFEYY